MPVSARQIEAIAASKRLTRPTLAIAGGVVGETLHRQLAPITDHLEGVRIANCEYNIPEEQPDALAAALISFLSS